MSVLPRGWICATLSEVATWSSGGTPKTTVKEYYGGDIPWVVTGDLTEGPVSATADFLSNTGLAHSSAKIVPPGTVLIAMYGASIGRLGIAGRPVATNQAIATAQVHPELVGPKYLFYYLKGQRPRLAAAGKGGAQPNISQTVLKAWPIPLAPSAEQERIVAVIEEQFSRLDAGVAALERVRRNLQRMKASVLDSPYERVPAAWVPLSAVGDIVTGNTPTTKVAGNYGGELPFITPSDFDHGDIVASSSRGLTDLGRSRARTLPQGSVLATCIGMTLGKVALAEVACATNQQINAVCPSERVLSKYLFYCLSRPSFARAMWGGASSTTMPILNKSRFSRLLVPLAPLEHQQAIVAEIEQGLRRIDPLAREVDVALRRITSLRSAILAMAFAGKLVLQDPNDDAAYVPVARIATEDASFNRNSPSGRIKPRTARSRVPA